MKNNTEKQPFTMNHAGDTMTDIMGIGAEEREKAAMENTFGDIPFGVFLLGVISEEQALGAVLSMVLSGVLDKDLHTPSQIAEYIVRTVPEGERRVDIYKALAFAKETGGGEMGGMLGMMGALGLGKKDMDALKDILK